MGTRIICSVNAINAKFKVPSQYSEHFNSTSFCACFTQPFQLDVHTPKNQATQNGIIERTSPSQDNKINQHTPTPTTINMQKQQEATHSQRHDE
eukprot:m.258231 g.258231  ORF g.258231 m.258231 type:complete len:94 (+) comp15536_c3_seq7:5952-6233(+)